MKEITFIHNWNKGQKDSDKLAECFSSSKIKNLKQQSKPFSHVERGEKWASLTFSVFVGRPTKAP